MLKRHISSTVIYGLLIGWSLLGFFFNLDYTQNSGCIVFEEPVFSAPNVLYSGVALVLLSIGYFLPSRNIGTVVLIAELLFWLYKLYFVKKGYFTGFGGGLSEEVVLFDAIALTLRLMLMKNVLQLPLKTKHVLLVSLVIMAIKIQ